MLELKERKMRKRLIICLAGAAVGACVASTLNDSLGLSPAATRGVCSFAGMAVGYVGSTLLDVFAAKPDSRAIRSEAD
jgi:hypothetical protein